MPTIVGVVVARNEVETLPACLASLAGLDALWVIDNGSSDGTAALAASLGAHVLASDLSNMGCLRQLATAQVAADWMVMLDADERLPADGVATIRRLVATADRDLAALSVRIDTHLGGRPLRWGGYRVWRPRVFRIAATRWPPARVHERPVLEGRLAQAPIGVVHHSYRDLGDAIAKTRRYARHAALDDAERGLRRGMVAASVRSGWRFVRVLLLRHGWLMGRLGWRLAWLQAKGVWWRYRGGW